MKDGLEIKLSRINKYPNKDLLNKENLYFNFITQQLGPIEEGNPIFILDALTNQELGIIWGREEAAKYFNFTVNYIHKIIKLNKTVNGKYKLSKTSPNFNSLLIKRTNKKLWHLFGLLNIFTNHLDYVFENRENFLSHLDFSERTLRRKYKDKKTVEYKGQKYFIVKNILKEQITDKTIIIKKEN